MLDKIHRFPFLSERLFASWHWRAAAFVGEPGRRPVLGDYKEGICLQTHAKDEKGRHFKKAFSVTGVAYG